MTVYTTLPTDDENLEVTVVDDPDLVTLNITPAQVTGSGAVSSVNSQTGAVVLDTDDISEGSNNKYFTTSGAAINTDNLTEGSTNLYYADSLVDAHLTGGTGVTYSAGDISIGQPVGTTDDVTFGEVESTEFIGPLRGEVLFKAQAGEALTKGDAVYVSGISGNTPVVQKANASSASHMPAFGVAGASVSTSVAVDVITFGQATNLDTTGNGGETWALGDEIYVSATTAGDLTNVQPTGESNLVQKIAKVEKLHALTGTLLISGAGRSNATPNLNDGNIFIGDSSNYATTSSLDTEVDALGYITDSSTDTLTNKSGSNSQWTNDEAYIKADSTDTLTNKSGNISQWTNDSNYSTTTNNADNRVITGTGTTNTLNGESLFTYDGDHMTLEGTADGINWSGGTPPGSGELQNAVANIKTDNSGWDKVQLSLEDSNAKVMGLVGEDDTATNAMKYVVIMDPDGEHNPSGGYTGDYGFYYIKDYSDVGNGNITMEHNVFGANNGFIMQIKSDFTPGGGNQYDFKPMEVRAEHFRVNARNGVRSTATALTVDNTKADFSVPVQLPNLTTTERNALTGATGMTIYNTDEDRIEYYDGAWKYISGTAV